MINKVIIQGNVMNDPELKTGNSGKSYCNFCIGTANINGFIDYFYMTIFGPKAVAMCNSLKDGDSVIIEGKLTKTLNPTDNKRRIEIIALDYHKADTKKQEDGEPLAFT